MSEEFEKIKNEVNSFRLAAENKIESEKRAIEEKIKKEELLLEKSGVRQLYEEIRDNRLVESEPPSKNKVWVEKLFGRGYYEEIIEYHPAHITSTRIKHNGVAVASLSLEFNHVRGWEPVHKEVRVAIVGEELCLVEVIPSGDHYKGNNGSLTPIRERELATTIAKALKNPMWAETGFSLYW